MIDAGVRVHLGVDIYGPCSGLACCGLGGLFAGSNKTSGANGICILAVKKKGVITNGSNMPFNTNRIIYVSKAMPVGRRGKCLH